MNSIKFIRNIKKSIVFLHFLVTIHSLRLKEKLSFFFEKKKLRFGASNVIV